MLILFALLGKKKKTYGCTLCLFRMPWQGRQDVLIDRFDVRAHLDYIPENPVQAESVPNEELSREDRLANYERYRIIVQNDFLGSKYAIQDLFCF